MNWKPVGPALTKPVGSVWACDIAKHGGRYYIYIPARTAAKRSNYVDARDSRCAARGASRSTSICRRTSIPGHIVGEDGKRYLFLSRRRPRAAHGRWACDRRRGGARLRSVALSRRLGRRELLARRPEGHAPRRIFLHGHRGRRHRRPADRPHGDRRALEVDPRPVGELSAQSARAHAPTRARNGGRAATRRWSKGRAATGGGLSRLRERLLDARPPDAARSDRVDRGRLVPRQGRRPVAADSQAREAASQTARHRAVGRFQQPTSSACSGRSTIRAPTRCARVRYEDGALVLTGKGDSPSDCSPLHLHHAATRPIACGSKSSWRARRQAACCFFYNKRLYCGLGFDERQLVHASLRPRRAAARSRQASAGACTSASRTIGTS